MSSVARSSSNTGPSWGERLAFGRTKKCTFEPVLYEGYESLASEILSIKHIIRRLVSALRSDLRIRRPRRRHIHHDPAPVRTPFAAAASLTRVAPLGLPPTSTIHILPATDRNP
jgi:hypothetical protein